MTTCPQTTSVSLPGRRRPTVLRLPTRTWQVQFGVGKKRRQSWFRLSVDDQEAALDYYARILRKGKIVRIVDPSGRVQPS